MDWAEVGDESDADATCTTRPSVLTCAHWPKLVEVSESDVDLELSQSDDSRGCGSDGLDEDDELHESSKKNKNKNKKHSGLPLFLLSRYQNDADSLIQWCAHGLKFYATTEQWYPCLEPKVRSRARV